MSFEEQVSLYFELGFKYIVYLRNTKNILLVSMFKEPAIRYRQTSEQLAMMSYFDDEE